MFGNDQAWMDQVLAAAARTDERVWHLPLVDDYRKLLDSNVADMKNVGGPYGGAHHRPGCSCGSSSAMCRGRTSTSPA